MKKTAHIVKKIFTALLILLLLSNVFILATGRSYIYRAVFYTYLHGQSGPGIYDKDYFFSREIERGNPVSWPVSRHFNKKQLSPALQTELENYQTTGFLVIQNDSLLYEKYFEKADAHTFSNSFSMAKSVVALLVCIAVQEEKVKSLDQPVKEFLPWIQEDAGTVTIRHLVTMASGMDWGESGGNPLSDNARAYYGTDLETHLQEIHFTQKPGKIFDYRSGNTELLGMLLKKATGMELSQYASEKLWKPLQAEHEAYWSLDHEAGWEKAYCCIYSTLRDIARLGKLMLHFGEWEGKHILDSVRVAEIIHPVPLVDTDSLPNQRYGMGWWIVTHKGVKAFYMRGILGQYIICIPERNMIVARAGHKRGEKNNDQPLDMLKYIEAGLELAR